MDWMVPYHSHLALGRFWMIAGGLSLGDSWFSNTTDVFGWMVLDDCGCFGCLQIVLGGFKWFSMTYSFSRCGEIPCFKFKRSKQL